MGYLQGRETTSYKIYVEWLSFDNFLEILSIMVVAHSLIDNHYEHNKLHDAELFQWHQ